MAIYTLDSWSRQRLFDAPTERFDALVDAQPVKSGMSRPLGQCFSFSIQSQQSIVTLIRSLFFRCGPTAIVSRIVAVVILAFNAVLGRWTRPHVGQKRRKGLAPFDRHGDASSPVVFETFTARIKTTFSNSAPHFIFRCANAAVFSIVQFSQASATASQSACDFRNPDRLNLPALALKQPERFRGLASWVWSKGSQALKHLSELKMMHSLSLLQGRY